VEILGADGPGRRLFPPGDEVALAAALTRVLEHGDEERVGADALRQAVLQEYSWDAAADQTEALYARLVGNGR
jgi:glycosyltransferase involved in cell wall biosynthesis